VNGAQGGDGVYYDDYDSEEQRQKRQYRRQVIAEWKAEAKAIQSADPSRRMLMREAKREALAILEDAARTLEQFRAAMVIWDKAGIVEDWRVAKHEELTLNEMEDYELPDRDRVIPAPLNHIWWRQLLGGNFIDVIFDCPHEIHELTKSCPVYDYTSRLDEDHQEILYYWVIRQWSPQRIAVLRGQTDRNIRKVYKTMIDDIRMKMYTRLYPRYKFKEPLTFAQKEFCRTYPEQLDEGQREKILRRIGEEERRERTSSGGQNCE